MIANLVENAVRHNNPGGWIGVRTMQQDDSAVFEIANTGPSVPAEQIPTLFEPFARAKQRLNSSDGVGLGLSIASAIARAHNATITARPRAGGGLEMSVTIPGLTASYWRARCRRSSASASLISSPLTSTVTAWSLPVNVNGVSYSG